LSGAWHENDRPHSQFVSEGLDSSPLINSLEKNGYRIGIYEPHVLNLDSATHAGRYENMLELDEHFTSARDCAVLLVKMTGIKYFPWDLKEWCYNLPVHSEDIRVSEDADGNEAFSWSNVTFYEKLAQPGTIKATGGKTFRYIHVEGAHIPFQYNKQMEIIDEAEGTYDDVVDASLTIADRFLTKLRENGLYDNSTIIVMSDHGFADVDKQEFLEDRMHGILLIKGKGEKREEMAVSAAPLMYTDFAEAFGKLADGADPSEIFEYKDGDVRERRFIKYTYAHEDYMEEFVTKGKAWDLDAMTPTGVVYRYE
jgi:hypothetical protein